MKTYNTKFQNIREIGLCITSNRHIIISIFFSMAQLPLGVQGLLVIEAALSHSVKLLWTRNQPDAETFTCTIHNRQTCPLWDSNPQSQQTSVRRPTP